MKIEDQVCSSEIAKRREELGVEQEGIFLWKTDEGDPYLVPNNSRYMSSKGTIEPAAFTVAELGQMLPDRCSCWRRDGEWLCYMRSDSELVLENKMAEVRLGDDTQIRRAPTEADARANMLASSKTNYSTSSIHNMPSR